MEKEPVRLLITIAFKGKDKEVIPKHAKCPPDIQETALLNGVLNQLDEPALAAIETIRIEEQGEKKTLAFLRQGKMGVYDFRGFLKSGDPGSLKSSI